MAFRLSTIHLSMMTACYFGFHAYYWIKQGAIFLAAVSILGCLFFLVLFYGGCKRIELERAVEKAIRAKGGK